MVRIMMNAMRWTYLRYMIASAVSLAADMGLFLLLLGRLTPAAASAVGYGAGIVVHWLISSRAVFSEGAAVSGGERHRQKMLFLLSAFVGLALTVGIVGLGSTLGLDARLAKLAAIAVSFNAVYVLRKKIVFGL